VGAIPYPVSIIQLVRGLEIHVLVHSHLYLQAVKLEIWQHRVWVYSFISPRLLDSVFVSLNQKQ
jgi:hypothetical protein